MPESKSEYATLADLGRLLTQYQVCDLTGYSRQHIRKLEIKGRFPARLRLNGYSVRWIESEVLAWINRHIGRRRVAGVRGGAAASVTEACDV